MAVQMLGIKTKFTDDQGRPLVGGKVHAYFAGTTTYQDTFKDPDMTIINTNPIILDDSGSADVYLNGSYRIRIFDKNDVLIEEQDGVTQSASGEITTAKGEIIGLYGAVLNSLTNEVKRAVAAEKTIADSLTSETTRAKAAESALQSSISDETTRAKAAESDLNADIIKEVSDRESEVTRLDEADAVLQAQINSVGGGKLAYKTYAEMIADKSNIAAKSSIDIIADTDDKNGTYLYDGANFVKSQYDIEKIIRAKVQNTFGTYAQMVASNLSDGAYALVADDTNDKNGLYFKESGTWSESDFETISTLGLDPDYVLSIFDITLWNDGHYIVRSTGAEVKAGSTPTLKASDYFKLDKGSDSIVIAGYGQNTIALYVFYDENKNYISGGSGNVAGYQVTTLNMSEVPENAEYIRITGDSRYRSYVTGVHREDYTELLARAMSSKLPDIMRDNGVAINDFQEVISVGDWTDGYYVHTNGSIPLAGSIPTLRASKLYEIDKTKDEIVINGFGTGQIALYAIYAKDKSLLTASAGVSSLLPQVLTLSISNLPEGAHYIRITGDTRFVSSITGVHKPSYFDRVAAIAESVYTSKNNEAKDYHRLSTVFITGASLAYDGNAWFSLASDMLGVTGINKARSGSGRPSSDANLFWRGTFITDEQFEDIDVFSFQYANIENISSTEGLKSTADEYTQGFDLNDPSNPFAYYSEAQNMDYILKMLQAKCYAQKDNPNSKWYGTQHGKPFRVLFITHWHDLREYYNLPVRELAKRWGAGLCAFDEKIGFSKNTPLPDGTQVSVLYAQDTQTVDGVDYGWHPKRGESSEYIQQRMADIYTQSVIEFFGFG